MTNSLDDSDRGAVRRLRGGILAPLACLTAALGVLLVASAETNELAASQSRLGPDNDADGLADAMEAIFGTSSDSADTDGDGYDDIEEIARGSDPLDRSSIPASNPLDVGMYVYVENEVLNLHTALYVEGGDFLNLAFELGVVIDGKRLIVNESFYASGARWFFYDNPKDPRDVILIGEMPVPITVAQRKKRLSIYSVLQDNGALAARPSAVDITDLDEIDGEMMQIISAPSMVKNGAGIVYRPIGTSGGAPTTAVTGQICWQSIVAVGTNGTEVMYEIDEASCESFASSCAGASCAGSVGTGLNLPSPGALLGG